MIKLRAAGEAHRELRSGGRASGLAAALLALIAGTTLCADSADAQSLQFFGTGTNNSDRVRIRIDAPATPADIGSTDFTIEFWLRTTSGNNAGAISPGANYNWTNGNIVFDRDRFGKTQAFGISLGAGRVTFGVKNESNEQETWGGTTDVRNGAWHHIVVQRRVSTGGVDIYVDGSREVNNDPGPSGDLSYPNGETGATNDPFIVLAAEKHDFDPPNFPSYSGYLTELRLSRAIKYTGASFTVPTATLGVESDTVALYHFSEGSGTTLGDSTPGGASPGEVRPGAQWSTQSPFPGTPSAGTLQLQGATASVNEAAGSITLSITRTGGSSGAATVDYATANGTAVAGADYTTTMGTANWGNGISANQPITVPILNDAQFEANKTFTVTISNATGATLGTQRTTTVTILDDDQGPSPGTVQLSASAYAATEGTGPPPVLVRRVGGSDGAASVTFATVAGTATAGSDYTAQSGTVQWANGDAADKPVNVPIIDDIANEPAETLEVQLSNPTGAALGTPPQATITIAASDQGPATPGNVQFANATLDVNEGAGAAVLRLTRVAGSQGAISVTLNTANGSAISGSDFTGQSMVVVNWASGDAAEKTVSVPIASDTSDEPNENFTAQLSNPTGGATLGAQSSIAVNIIDDDAPPGGGSTSSDGGGLLDLLTLGLLFGVSLPMLLRRIRDSRCG